MRTIRAAAAAVLLALLASAAPADAAQRTSVTGRVLDEAGRGVAGATVLFVLPKSHPAYSRELTTGEEKCEFVWFLFFFSETCTRKTTPDTTPTAVRATTDRNGRYVLRVKPHWRVAASGTHDVTVIGRSAASGMPRARTVTTVNYQGGPLRTVHLWGQVASVDPVSGTERDLKVTALPKAMGRPYYDPIVRLLQGSRTVWSYGRVSGSRRVDTLTVVAGTTGVQAEVATSVNGTRVWYRSAPRAVRSPHRPASRGLRCHSGRSASNPPIPGCPLTDGRLATPELIPYDVSTVVVDLEEPMLVDAYVAHQCAIRSVEASLEGSVYLPVSWTSKDRVYRSDPFPARYVRIELYCDPTEVSVFGEPLLPQPPANNYVVGTGVADTNLRDH